MKDTMQNANPNHRKALIASLMSSVCLIAACGGGASNDGSSSVAAADGAETERESASALADWVAIATEGQSFKVSGTQTVRYGKNTSWISKSVTDGGKCSNSFFNLDPIYGMAKECQVDRAAVTAPAPAPAPSSSWTSIATEGNAFTVSGTQTVRYGKNSTWVSKSVTNGGQCTNSFFGRDPLPNVVKECQVAGTSAPAPAPAPAPSPAPAPAPTTSCSQTLNPGANVASAVAAAAAGSTICLNGGSYGTASLSNVSKTSDVTIRSTADKSASIAFSITNSNHLRLQNLTIARLNMWQAGNKNISVLGNKFAGQFTVTGSGSGSTPANILIDGNTFDGISVGPNDYEGRLQIYNGGGITVSNNHFGGGGESDGIQMGGYGGIVGPGNVFDGLVYNGGRHVDAIQLYGQVSHHTITGNFFIRNADSIMAPDGGDSVTITNNVFIGNNISYGEIQLGSHTNPVFTHNVVSGMAVGFDKKSELPNATSNARVTNNIFVTSSRLGVNCSGCSFLHNQFDSSSSPYGSDNILTAPQFAGGTPSWSAYKLTSGSPGYRAATDGTDMGIN